ncbi:hypothetical protein F4819DRAFT_423210 [Hypoxylon fuscum]|nr:hypothetical protein F4819DRAFT_423210 [Hypoxylon fuscum]
MASDNSYLRAVAVSAESDSPEGSDNSDELGRPSNSNHEISYGNSGLAQNNNDGNLGSGSSSVDSSVSLVSDNNSIPTPQSEPHSTDQPTTSGSRLEPPSHQATETDEASSASFLADGGIDQGSGGVRLRLKESIGIYGIFIIIAGGLINVGAWCFLLFLWFGGGQASNGAQAPHFWRYLMLNSWITQTITLTSLVLRLFVSAQATICTSLLAALVLENHHVHLSEAARYTILRGVNDGPMGLIQLTFSSLQSWKKAFGRIESLLITILFLTALAVNFSSTILLSDVGFSGVVHDQTTKEIPLAFNLSTTVFVPSTEYWNQRPRAYATFGEINSGMLAAPNDRGLSDTGVVRRVFFPLSNASERTTTSRYSGAAWVMTSRTTCMPPEIQGLISGDATFGGGMNSGFGRFSGNISYDMTLQRAGLSQVSLCDSQKCLPTQFDCTFPGASGYASEIEAGHEWVHSFCVLSPTRNFTDPDDVGPPTWNIDNSPVSSSSTVHLILGTNGPSSYWKRLGNETFNTRSAGTYDEWNSYKIEQGILINASICFSAVNVTISQVTLQAQGKIDEPTINFDRDTMQWDSTSVRIQLGANESVQDFDRRGIFQVETIRNILPDGSNDASQPFNLTVAEASTSVLQNAIGSDTFPLLDDTDHTVNLCDVCTKYGTGMDREITTLLGDILRSTRHAAMAILTTWSVLGQTYFTDLLDLFDVAGEAQVVSVANVQVPLRRQGFIAVSVILAVHLTNMVVITIFYVAKTRYSRQGNIWYAISQIVCRETQAILTESNEMKDDRVADSIKHDDHPVKLTRSDDNGRVELVKVIRK